MALTSFLQLQAEPGNLRGILFWTMDSVAGARWDGLILPLLILAIAGGEILTQGARTQRAGPRRRRRHRGGHRRAPLWARPPRRHLRAHRRRRGIGFVGLIVPHAVRLVVGADHRTLLPLSALTGAVFLVAVDLAARTVGSPNEYPLTIFTALVGGPFFLWLMRTRQVVAP